jgi:hypothetical protein
MTSEEFLQDAPEVGKYRLRVRNILFAQGVLIIILATLSIPLSGAKVSPLYIPIPWFLITLLAGGIILSIEAFILRGKELGLVNSNSKRYIIARYTMRDSTYLAILALVIGVVLILPPVKGFFNDISSQRRSDSIYGYKCVNYPSMDWLGLSRVVEVWVHTSEGNTEVYLMTRGDGDRFCVNREGEKVLDLAIAKANITQVTPFSYPLNTEDLQEFTLVIHPIANKEIIVEYGVDVRVVDTVLPLLGVLLFIYGVVNAVFAMIAYSAMKRFEKGSIYRK